MRNDTLFISNYIRWNASPFSHPLHFGTIKNNKIWNQTHRILGGKFWHPCLWHNICHSGDEGPGPPWDNVLAFPGGVVSHPSTACIIPIDCWQPVFASFPYKNNDSLWWLSLDGDRFSDVFFTLSRCNILSSLLPVL